MSSFRLLLNSVVCALLCSQIHALPTGYALNVTSSHVAPVDIYNATAPALVGRAASPLELPIITDLDSLFLAKIVVGSQKKEFQVVLDSDSADFWLFHDSLNTDMAPRFGIGASVSSTFTPDQTKTWEIFFEDGGEVNGFLATDDVTVGTATFPKFEFGAADDVAGPFLTRGNPEQGVMGFSPGENPHINGPLIATFEEEGLVPSKVSGWKLPRAADGGKGGELVMGGVNEALFDATKKVTVPNVDPTDDFWRIADVSITLDGKPPSDPRNQKLTSLIDTGTSAIFLEAGYAKEFHAQIPGSAVTKNGVFTMPCNTKAQLVVTIAGRQFSFDPRDLSAPDEDLPQGMCESRVQAGTSAGQATLGAPLLKNLCLILDPDNSELSFAKLK